MDANFYKKKKKKNNNLIIKVITITAAAIIVIGIGSYFLFRKKDNQPIQSNLGQQQNQQTQSAVLQLASNLLGNTNNLNQLTKKQDGTPKTIQEIEEEFLISAFQPGQSPVGGIGGGLSPEVIERIWWELRPWIEEYLRDPNQSILDHAREKFRRDVENWLKWQQREYSRQLEEYQKHLQELQRIEDLIAWYQKIREEELLEKISRKTELRNKGYIDRDIEKLREWNLITPNQEIPDLNAEKRIGATNILWTSERQWGKIGGSSDLIIFLKPKLGRIPQVKGNQNNSETVINFSTEIAYEDKEGYKQFVRDYLTEKGKFDYDAYCLIRTNSSMSGPSAGIAYYLALYSLINKVPLPRNLGSTGTVFERPKVGGIGGLNLKLGYNITKENPINIFILSELNRNKEACQKFNNGRSYRNDSGSYYDLVSSQIKEKIKQVHFISQVDQIETALQEILKNPNEKLVHSCGEVPERKPEKPNHRDPPQPTSEITSEQLLTLITELSIRENKGENRDFWEKLQVAYGKNANYQEVVNRTLSLQKEYLGKLEKLQKPDERNPQGKKIRKFSFASSGKIVKEEEVEENNKLTCKTCRQPFEEGYTVVGAGPQFVSEERWCPKCTEPAVKKNEIKIKEEKIGGKEPNNQEIEQKKQELYQEYQQKFQKIAVSVANLTNEIITNLEKNGYALTEIKWTDENFQAPSLTTKPSVSFSLGEK